MKEKVRFLLANDDWKFRRMNQVGLIDIDQAKYEKVRNLAFNLYLVNPLAQGIIELLTDFVVGANEFEIEVVSEDEKLKEELSDFIDFVFTSNELYEFRELYKELLLSGELHLPVGGSASEGLTIGFLPSLTVYQIEVDAIDHRKIKKIKYRFETNEFEYEPVTMRLNRNWTYSYEGNLFYFRINRTAGMLRGYSELISVIDWLDASDQLLWNSLETSSLRNMFYLLVKVIGGTEQEISEIEKKYREYPPKPGTILVGNDKLEWEVLKNDLNMSGITEVVRTYKNYILASKRLPEMWFAEGGYTNLATAKEMTTGALKMFQSRQREFKMMLYRIADYICYKYLEENGAVIRMLDFDFNIKLPALEKPEAKDIASVFSQIVNALAVSYDYGWIKKENAIDVVALVLNRLGIDIDAKSLKEEMVKVTEEGREAEAELIQKLNEVINR